MLSRIIQKASRYGPPNYFDRLKAIALITMTIDHVGFCLFPGEDIYRAIGRVSMPLWFFLIGYHTAEAASAGKNLKHKEAGLLASAFVLTAVNVAIGRPFFPLLIPVAILLCRRVLLWPRFQKMLENQPIGVFAVIAVALFPTMFFVEYGSVPLFYAVLGWWVARGQDSTSVRLFAIFTAAVYATIENIAFSFGPGMEWLVFLGVAFATFLPLEMRKGEWKFMAAKPGLSAITLFITRNSLLYYTLHFTFLKLLGYALHPPATGWFFRLF